MLPYIPVITLRPSTPLGMTQAQRDDPETTRLSIVTIVVSLGILSHKLSLAEQRGRAYRYFCCHLLTLSSKRYLSFLLDC